jgi:secondary thiamine-phosphate synthase enzyme
MRPPSGKTVRLSVTTHHRSEWVEITRQVEEVVRKQDVADGIVVVYVPHTTAGVCINENADPDVARDVLGKLDRLFPKDEPAFRHAEGNSDSHLKAIFTGSSVTVLAERGRLVLGQWQGIYLAEFDGPRSRTVLVKCIDGAARAAD